MQQRPQGVTILAVLAAIGGVFAIVTGLVAATAGSYAVFGISGVATVMGLLLIVGGCLDLALAYGAWNLLPWAWMLGIIAELILIVANVLTVGNGAVGALVGVAIAAAIIYYLWQPHVRKAFGQAV